MNFGQKGAFLSPQFCLHVPPARVRKRVWNLPRKSPPVMRDWRARCWAALRA